ncbi:MAG: hypothetical protein ACR2M4_12535 [Actinomycetota bacterium]
MGRLIDVAKTAMPEAGAKRETSAPGALWWRVSVREPGGRTIEVDAPSGWTLPHWEAYAERYHGPGCAVTPLVPLPKPRAPVHLDEALAAACEGVAGITPVQFRVLLSPEDIDDIEAGGIHPKTLHAYAGSFAEGLRSGRIAALPERKGAKPGLVSGSIVITEAEIEAARKGRTVVRQGTFSGAHEVKA